MPIVPPAPPQEFKYDKALLVVRTGAVADVRFRPAA